MVKLLVLSDLHLECAGFAPDLDVVRACDVVVLAGDIHPGVEGMRWARASFPRKPVVYVAGNHEYFGGDWNLGLELMRSAARECDVHFLENDTVTIAGIRFLGCTLWSDFEYFGQYVLRKMMCYAEQNHPDYQEVTVSEDGHTRALSGQLTLARRRASCAWLEQELPKGDPSTTVVMTHHYPNRRSTAPVFSNDALTAAFGSHISLGLMLRTRLWIHGHTHWPSNYRLGDSRRQVRVVCNPRGYPYAWLSNEWENPAFDPCLLLERQAGGDWGVAIPP